MLYRITFCGVDNSIAPELLHLVSSRYPWIEWGVLFRSDLAGRPRYPSWDWVTRLTTLSTSNQPSRPPMKLSAHLCGDYCQDLLQGKQGFVIELAKMGFERIQINATAANDVKLDHNDLSIRAYQQNVRKCMDALPQVEFILQSNTETSIIWKNILQSDSKNISVLFDESCGKGVRVPLTDYPSLENYPGIPCGYAGGIGPHCINDVLSELSAVLERGDEGNPLWIDMESSLRVKVVTSHDPLVISDEFSIQKCIECMLAVQNSGLLVDLDKIP